MKVEYKSFGGFAADLKIVLIDSRGPHIMSIKAPVLIFDIPPKNHNVLHFARTLFFENGQKYILSHYDHKRKTAYYKEESIIDS